jgi:FAD:protein FMN transferase
MPLVETLPVGTDTAQWTVWGTVARVVVTDPGQREDAAAIVRAELAAVDAACSRFRADSELMVACREGRAVTVSPLLAEFVGAALDAARRTDGAVDPTVGAAMCGLGYDRDLIEVGDAPAVRVLPTQDWTAVRLRGRELTVPQGILLDLGATAKALAADRSAAAVHRGLGTGVLVALGGDIATAGPAPDGGWRVLVRDRPGDPRCVVRLPAGAALATSSTVNRTWGAYHHILDPRAGLPVEPLWRTVSVAAHTCLEANTLSTAAIVRGPALIAGAPARLVGADLAVRTMNGWPA